MADAGLGARRDCEEMITAGRVRVNGRVVTTLPCFVDPANDAVELDGEPIELPIPEPSDTAAAAKNDAKARALIYV
jgi:23S rRNA pseudouridine2605 synthase